MGNGRMGGRGAGLGAGQAQGQRMGRGHGLGQGRGLGQGLGRGRGLGQGRFAVGYGPVAGPASEELREALETRKSFLGAELARVDALLATTVGTEPKADESGETK